MRFLDAMIPSPLSDLDELVLSVRDRNSRIYIGEAVHAYRNGLGRAAVILTWTALAYDLIAKYRELADQGESAALKFVSDLETAITAQNVPQLQQIENSLLGLARNPFELIDDREYVALERLREDRNHCAHPAFTGDSLLHSPLPELVRTHIVQCVTSVLQHAPLQGKTALARLKVDLMQASFPIQQDQVTTFLQSRYFGRLKLSLISRVITVLAKEAVLQPDPDLAKVPENLVRALVAASVTHPKEYEQGIRTDLPKFASSADDEKLWRVLLIIGNDPKVWDWMDKSTQIRLETLIKAKVSVDRLPMLKNAFNIPALTGAIESKYNSLDDDKNEKFIAVCPLPIVIEDAIRLFGASGSFRGAEERARNLVLPVAAIMTTDQIRRTLDAVIVNGQIWSASGIPEILKQFFTLSNGQSGASKASWKKFLKKIEKQTTSEHWKSIAEKIPK
jgi:hypothetical protein